MAATYSEESILVRVTEQNRIVHNKDIAFSAHNKVVPVAEFGLPIVDIEPGLLIETVPVHVSNLRYFVLTLSFH
jgi:hypothetical protein